MKNNYSSAVLLLLLFLFGCNNPNLETYISEINEASHALASVDNGRFNTSLVIDDGDELEEETIEGKFVKKDNEVDWYTAHTAGDTEQGSATLTEVTTYGHHKYQRFGQINQNKEYIDENNNTVADMKWIVVGSNNKDYPNVIDPLVSLELEDSMIDEIDKEEQGEEVEYTIQLSEDYLIQLRDEEIQVLQDNIDSFKELNVSPDVILELESDLEYQKLLTYENMTMVVRVNNEGVLIGHSTEIEVIDNEDEQTFKTSNSIEITEYNILDLEIEPVI